MRRRGRCASRRRELARASWLLRVHEPGRGSGRLKWHAMPDWLTLLPWISRHCFRGLMEL